MRLLKHHGLGNDFLILIDLDNVEPVDAARARAICDRHTGVGADGLIRVTAGRDGADVSMQLRNADGSEAEMSGNGIRCLAQAVIDEGVVTGRDVSVATRAGVRRVTVRPAEAPGLVMATVDMGSATVQPADDEASAAGADRGAWVNMGNPHLVLLDPNWTVSLTKQGRQHPDANVEIVRPNSGGGLDMRVWERGVGQTLACGTGACAAAAAANEWGMGGELVTVTMPGGDVDVTLGPSIRLTGPAQRICAVEL